MKLDLKGLDLELAQYAIHGIRPACPETAAVINEKIRSSLSQHPGNAVIELTSDEAEVLRTAIGKAASSLDDPFLRNYCFDLLDRA